MAPLNICMICPYFHSKKHRIKLRPDILEVSTRLVNRGHKVVALASNAYGGPSYEVVEGVEVYRVSSLPLPNIFYFIPLPPNLVSELLEICRKHKIDILHFWNYEYLTSSLAFFLRRKLGSLPFVLTVIGFPGLNWHYGLKGVDIAGFIYTYTVGKLVLKSVDHVILLGKSLVRYASHMGVSEDKISINSFGIDFEEFHPMKPLDRVRKEFKIAPSDKVIIYVGRLEPVKGVTYLLEAAKHLSTNTQNLKFLIVGDGPLRSKFQKAENQHIIFTGWRRDVADLLNVSDIFVLPSLSEGLPISVLEAYALAKPVIATNVGAVPELVINNKTGLLIEPRNCEQIEEAIHHLTENPYIAKRMGTDGKKLVRKYHNWDYIMNKYEEIYNSLTH